MNASELKFQHESVHPESHFFDRKTMRFFGDTMANYGVRSVNVRTNWGVDGKWSETEGVVLECWELFRKRRTHKGATSPNYFDKKTLRVVCGVVV